jgi:hypothetical protein
MTTAKRRARDRKYYIKNKEKIKKRCREYYAKNKEKAKASVRVWQAKNKECVREISNRASKASRRRNPQIWKVRSWINNAIKLGRLLRAEECSACGVKCKTDAHHHNGYSDDKAFDIVWLCRACHRACHRIAAKNS